MIFSRVALVVALTSTPAQIYSFHHIAPLQRQTVRFGADGDTNGETKSADEPDLFDYFDPLLSPHAYPNGISPDHKPTDIKGTEEDFTSFDQQRRTSGVFDPLLSPNAYPNGTPDDVIQDEFLQTGAPDVDDDYGNGGNEIVVAAPYDPLSSPSDFVSLLSSVSKQQQQQPEQLPQPDVFDPLLSPHMYPNGTPDEVIANEDLHSGDPSSTFTDAARKAPTKVPPQPTTLPSISGVLEMPPVIEGGEDGGGLLGFLDNLEQEKQKSKQQKRSKQQEQPNLDLLFDPTISPHLYPNGTPENVVGDYQDTNLSPSSSITTDTDESQPPNQNSSNDNNNDNKAPKIGVLLMDHGSRNQSSNDGLHELAELYQSQVDPATTIVQAAHMELASPTIPEGLQSLLGQGVDRIICCPYFLSGKGRHVSEDIPQIIDGAIEEMDIGIPIATTQPVGSMTDIMIQAISTLVVQNSNVVEGK